VTIYVTFLSQTNRSITVVKVVCYKCRWFDSRWCRWNFSFT